MKEKLRALRFWLSAVIFEKYLQWPAAQEIGAKIDAECRDFNHKHWDSCCHHCGGSDLVSKVSGSDGGGLFSYTSPHRFYECKKCGNQQDDSGSRRRYTSDELKPKRIIKDSADQYRYKFITEKIGKNISTTIISLLVLAVTSPFILLICAIWFNIGPFAR